MRNKIIKILTDFNTYSYESLISDYGHNSTARALEELFEDKLSSLISDVEGMKIVDDKYHKKDEIVCYACDYNQALSEVIELLKGK